MLLRYCYAGLHYVPPESVRGNNALTSGFIAEATNPVGACVIIFRGFGFETIVFFHRRSDQI